MSRYPLVMRGLVDGPSRLALADAAFTKSERVLGTAEQLLGRKAVHYHSKQLLKHPQAGGMWNWHQVGGNSRTHAMHGGGGGIADQAQPCGPRPCHLPINM